MNRVGIITMYHNSENYGGILQAYALAKKINLLGGSAKQISFDTRGERIFGGKQTFITTVKVWIANFLKKVSVSRLAKSRIIKKFRDGIPHTKVVNSDNIKSLLSEFDIFICGSDQVWNPSALCKEYLLSFVPPEKIKISYAASISRDTLTQQEQHIFQQYLQTFTDISVRESNDVLLLEPCVHQKVEWVMDPVFLLSSKDWSDVAGERLIKEKYVFCYFLNEKNKKPAMLSDFSKSMDAITVQVDGLGLSSKMIADRSVKNVGPVEFLSLIQHAEYVLTDSFHAMSFSFLLQKNFIVFPRNNERTMETRITSFLSLIGRTDLFVDTTVDVNELTELSAIDYTKEYTDFEHKKAHSVNFIQKYL